MKEKYKSIEELPLGLSVPQIGSVLGISRSKAYELVNSENFPKIVIGKRLIVPKDAFLRWMDAQIGKCDVI